jgi:hypothetical protein
VSRIKLYRVKVISAVILPGTSICTVPDPNIPYRGDDPLVKAYPWMFESDEDAIVEEASADPGERRRLGRPPLPRDAEGNIIR